MHFLVGICCKTQFVGHDAFFNMKNVCLVFYTRPLWQLNYKKHCDVVPVYFRLSEFTLNPSLSKLCGWCESQEILVTLKVASYRS